MESPEIVEILMEDESGAELEELNELIEGSQNASSSPPPSSSDEEKIEIEFRHRRETDTASIHDFTGLPNGIKKSAAPNISPESSPFAIFFFFSSARFCNITERNKLIFSSICCLLR